MIKKSIISLLIFNLFLSFNELNAASKSIKSVSVWQVDSLIKEKGLSKNLTQFDLMLLYEAGLVKGGQDSIQIFKNLAFLNAELKRPQEAYFFSEKYIKNTFDFSILKDNSYRAISHTKEYKVLTEKYLSKIDLFTFLFFYVALIGFFFTIVINFSKKAEGFSKLFIAGFVAVHSLFILEFVLYISNLRLNKFPHTFLMASSTALLYGPLLYFYFKCTTYNYKLKTLDILHFIPNVALVIYLLPFYFLPVNDKIAIMLGLDASYKINKYVIFFSKVVSLVIYAFLIRRIYFSIKKSKLVRINKDLSVDKWMKTIYYIHVAYIACYVMYGLPKSGVLKLSNDFIGYAQVAAMSVMVIYIAYMAYIQPNVFNKEFNAVKDLLKAKYKKSALTNSLSCELKESLIKLLNEDKIYKQSNISLELLSNKLNTTRHNTSQIINEHFDMNFFELINKFRIKEAINILEKDIQGGLKIIDVAYEVGYNNKVTFNKAFKKETMQTPSEFINTQLKK